VINNEIVSKDGEFYYDESNFPATLKDEEDIY
jgi:hypothetical protein